MKKPPSASAQARLEAARQEVEHQLRFLRRLIAMKKLTLLELTERLSWGKSKVNMILSGKVRLTYADLLGILEALDIAPGDFFNAFYSHDPWTLDPLIPEPLASDLPSAAKRLREAAALVVGTADFVQLYVRREGSPESLVRGLTLAHRQRRPVRWFVVGQPGVGVTTEMSVLGHALFQEGSFLPWPVQVSQLSPRSVDAETVLALALREVTELVESLEIERSDHHQIVDGLKTTSVLSTGRVARLLEAVADASRRQLGRELVLVVEGLEHLDLRRGARFFEHQLEILLRPAVSQVVVIPAFLLATGLEAPFTGRTSFLPPIPVVDEVLGLEGVPPDGLGLAFFEDLIGRYLPLELISKEARRSLVSLSAGIVGDLLAMTQRACMIAHEQVGFEHVEAVAEKLRKRWSRLPAHDLSTLRQLVDHPFRQDSPSLPRLVATKAVVVRPREGGLAFEVHPLLRPS